MKKVLCILLVAEMMSYVCACAAPAVKETSAEVKSPQEPDATEGQTTEAVTDYEYPEMTIISVSYTHLESKESVMYCRIATITDESD